MYKLVVTFYLLLNSKPIVGLEPTCSPFHYEEKTLEKMIRQEILVEKMKNEIEDIKHKVTETLKDLHTEKNKIAEDSEKKSKDFEAMKDDMKATVAEIQARTNEHIEAYTAEIEKIKESAVTPTIIFKAFGTDDKIMTNGKVIKFTKSDLNVGNAYNNQTGMFVAPVGGSYLFTAQICTDKTDWAYYGIFLEERSVSNILHGDKYYHSCSTFDAIAVVEKGMQVSVRCASSCDEDLLSEDPGYSEISFAGILLHRSEF